MALVTCPDCAGTVSTRARACPHCGCTRAAIRRATLPPSLTYAVLQLAIFAGVGFMAFTSGYGGLVPLVGLALVGIWVLYFVNLHRYHRGRTLVVAPTDEAPVQP